MPGKALAALALAVGASACSGGGGGTSDPVPPASQPFLSRGDVAQIVTRAVAEAEARGLRAQVAVVDRVGNVLGVYAMPGAPATVRIGSGPPGSGGGLETPVPVVPAALAAISKALTGAYLSSNGNAFSTRTAGQIIQEHFNPDESQQPSGPLFGVQFSQLSCSDVNRNLGHGSVGPKRSPLGLSADPGGLPLYKGGALVGGVGVELDGLYGIDRDLDDIDESAEEQVALAGSTGFAAPADIRADRITADGRTLRFVDSESLAADPARAPSIPDLAARFASVEGYSTGSRDGTPFGTPPSGIRADAGPFAARGGWVLVDASGTPRYAPRASSDGLLSVVDVTAILEDALAVAARARAQIRRPLGSAAQVSIAVVDTNGDILALVRTADGPLFGIDVAVQKARTAMFMSHADAASELLSAPAAQYLGNGALSEPGEYVARARALLGDASAFGGATAWSARAIGNLHRPMFPDGIDGTPAGPLSRPIGAWSPFNVGLQLDLVNNQLVRGVLGDLAEGCAGRQRPDAAPATPDPGLAKVRNGLQIFPGGVPIYRAGQLVGGVGVSGDGVDQDDMIAFLGLHNAGARLANGIGHAPGAMRADRLTPEGTRLRYVQCPQAPFLDSSEQDACAGK